ncbi:MAG: hypothetical protein J6O61_10085 [Butyrivibrio sp.]|uniref:hypothetical protein n=1 Tax=Butyrivibrio sp. TaxID=28121 RepID=UPI001B0C2B7E|nr:hypothetical protein [Butyrivibrio sp.]MBO6241157.1 hypothetical protein [Butyrivibrio sp.]
MTVDAYLNPDFTLTKKLIFLLITFAGIGLCVLGIYIYSRISARKYVSEKRKEYQSIDFEIRLQKFFEMLIAGTAVMSFSCTYVIINHVYSLVSSGKATNLTSIERYLANTWADGKDFILLFLILFSCVINTVLDCLIIRLKILTNEEKATMRMLAMFYVILILMYLNNIGDESEYGPVMMYYFGLMIGRFVYFDASFKDFLNNIKNVFLNMIYLILDLALTGLLCYIGFQAGYFLERNYYIVGIFHTQLFMLAAIFIIHYGRKIIDCYKQAHK